MNQEHKCASPRCVAGPRDPRPPRLRAALCAVLIAWLAACQPVQQMGDGTAALERQAREFAAEERHGDAARAWLELASRSSDERRQRYLILAAGEQRRDGRPEAAQSTLEQVTLPVADQNVLLYAEVSGAIALDMDAPDRALAVVERAPAGATGQAAANLLAIRAEALFRLGRPVAATGALVDREIWLDDPESIAGNQQRIWNSYQRYADTIRPGLAGTISDPVVAGWLGLADIARADIGDSRRLRQGLGQWQLAHPDHPANDYLLPALLGDLARDLAAPAQLAVLLPLSGRQAAAGEALRDGLLAAHYGAGTDAATAVRIYDTAGGAARAYAQAISEGADFLVGPLIKEEVREIAAAPAVVKTLALNYLPDDMRAPPGLYQFALSPEDEARQAAALAAARGQLRAIALAPDNEWGRRMLSSFGRELEARGGRVIDYRFFDTLTQDYTLGIEDLLLIDESDARADRLRANLGIPMGFEPRRRSDIDLIFLAANAESGRLIRPQLRFHYAGDIPTYATSAIYEEQSRSNSDLNGIMFPDLPWMLDPDPETRAVRETLNRYWPGQAERRARLYALGYDAYRIVPLLFAGEAGDARVLADGKTGRLYLDADRRIHRQLPWARFRRGRAELLAPPEQPAIDPVEAPIEVPVEAARAGY